MLSSTAVWQRFNVRRKYNGHESMIDKAVWAQEEDLEQQLQWGVRFLDLRVGYCEQFM